MPMGAKASSIPVSESSASVRFATGAGPCDDVEIQQASTVMSIPAFPSDAKTIKLAALIALGLLGALSLLALLQQRFSPEREQRERSRGTREQSRSAMPPEVQRQFQKFLKDK